MPALSRVVVGRVGRPHGLQGAFVVENASEAPERFTVGAEVLVGGEPARVLESKHAGQRLVLRLDRPVELGAPLEVARDDLPEPEADAYYVVDLVGTAVEEEGGRALGTVQDVVPGAANDVLELDSGLALPFAETCVLDVDLAGGRIVVARGFADPD